jgi:hypothetical protein
VLCCCVCVLIAAIQRYIAKTHGLYGANDLESLQIDGVYEALLDSRAHFNTARQYVTHSSSLSSHHLLISLSLWCLVV